MWQMHIVSGYIGGFNFFLFWGGWTHPSHSERMWVQRTFSMERDWSAAPRREAKLFVILSEYSGWQENILEFYSSSQLLKNVPTRASLPNQTAVWNPSSPHGMSSQVRLWPGDSSSQRRRCLTKKYLKCLFPPLPGTSYYSHVTFWWLGGQD